MKYYLLLLIPFIMSCEDSINLDVNKDLSIHYSFRDSSVPPRYHRSYDITITSTNAHIVVKSYGNKLADENYGVKKEDFNNLIEIINEAELVSGSVDAEPGCTGGTGESLIMKEEKIQVYKGTIDNCGGTTIPSSLGKIEKVVEAIKAFIPNLAELRK
ncbi:MAG: hypothetical protein GQ574_12280 [Crocinitomix sp.]|nr:hypothetical protein [Crocinitomix sp.]